MNPTTEVVRSYLVRAPKPAGDDAQRAAEARRLKAINGWLLALVTQQFPGEPTPALAHFARLAWPRYSLFAGSKLSYRLPRWGYHRFYDGSSILEWLVLGGIWCSVLFGVHLPLMFAVGCRALATLLVSTAVLVRASTEARLFGAVQHVWPSASLALVMTQGAAFVAFVALVIGSGAAFSLDGAFTLTLGLSCVPWFGFQAAVFRSGEWTVRPDASRWEP